MVHPLCHEQIWYRYMFDCMSANKILKYVEDGRVPYCFSSPEYCIHELCRIILLDLHRFLAVPVSKAGDGFVSLRPRQVAPPHVKGILQNVNHGGRRGTVFSCLTVADDLGKGLGPTIVYVLIAVRAWTPAWSKIRESGFDLGILYFTRKLQYQGKVGDDAMASTWYFALA